jgi:Mannosyltransferase OCH1 and related enzymes
VSLHFIHGFNFVSTLQNNSFNPDAIYADSSPADGKGLRLAPALTLTAPTSQHITSMPPKNRSEDISRVIHRMWRNISFGTPDAWIDASESCQKQNPSYDEYIWTEESAR